MKRPSIAILGHDAGNNALGRALALGDLLESSGDVRIFAFGNVLWPAARDQRRVELLRPARTTAGLPSAAGHLRSAIRDADILVAVKPRMMSYGMAAIVRGRRPLLLDIDDLEYPFTRRRLGWLRQLVEPDREPMTRLLDRVRRPVAAVTVASRALQRRHGGTWIPHVRDRSRMVADARAHGPTVRANLGLEASFVVGFVGTVRPHKGLEVLCAAIADLGGEARLLIAGDLPDHRTQAELTALSNGRLVTLAQPAMTEIGAILGACDVVAIPQTNSIEAAYQSPAKLLDALAAGRPVVASDIGDAREIVGAAGRIVPPGDSAALVRVLDALRSAPGVREQLGNDALERAREAFSIGHWQEAMADVVSPLIEHSGLA